MRNGLNLCNKFYLRQDFNAVKTASLIHYYTRRKVYMWNPGPSLGVIRGECDISCEADTPLNV